MLFLFHAKWPEKSLPNTFQGKERAAIEKVMTNKIMALAKCLCSKKRCHCPWVKNIVLKDCIVRLILDDRQLFHIGSLLDLLDHVVTAPVKGMACAMYQCNSLADAVMPIG